MGGAQLAGAKPAARDVDHDLEPYLLLGGVLLDQLEAAEDREAGLSFERSHTFKHLHLSSNTHYHPEAVFKRWLP